jgi:chromosome segregation ATPase
MNPKSITIILIVIILALGGIGGMLAVQKSELTSQNNNLLKEKDALTGEVNSLRNRYQQVEAERDDLAGRLSVVGDELSQVEQERDSLNRRVDEISQERDTLVERLSKSPRKTVEIMHQQQDQSSQADVASEEHWADFVKKKAALEVTLAGLNKSLLDAKNKIAELGKNNKELSIKIDQLTKEKQRLSESIKFKERTLRVMSMDLVSEREERSVAVKEVGKLRGENIGLKRELVLANKEQMKLQNDFKSTLNRKDALERRIMEAENVLREKSLAFEELQGRLRQAIAGGRKIIASESAAVELPPIVVKPTIPGLGGIRGEIIAVNREENFVVIDAGEASGLRPGAILKTMRGNREIATLEVIETRREISAADVVETLGGFYLQEGDVVISR